jgi:methylenetetrahydrofolate dehydrogenase (NADP+)/methenyltetrahydrofolate cyclohydrolase
MPILLEGTRVRDEILSELRPRVERMKKERGRPPGLAVVLVGEDPASQIYVRNKVKACHDTGIYSEEIKPPSTMTTAELLKVVDGLNQRDDIDGILVQMPLPKQIDSRAVLEAISPTKDSDGFHPYNVGSLVANMPGPRACTPFGVMEILRRYKIPVDGRHAVVVGRSDIVGKPQALLLLHANATVTICHSKTPDLPDICRRADILVAAIGRPAFVRKDFIKPGATVIDVGINRVTDEQQVKEMLAAGGAEAERRMAIYRKSGAIVVGDVHPLEMEHASAYTPVPGGVGPLTIAMLLANTVGLAERRSGLA